MTIAEALRLAVDALEPLNSEARLEAELLFMHVLACNRAYLYANTRQEITSQQRQDFFELIARRQIGEPIAYILGKTAFWNLDLEVTPATLIPRPETELLVSTALQLLSVKEKLVIADLGTGCGAIALALAAERPTWQIYATDESAAALQVAQANARRLALKNITFSIGNWCSALPKLGFDAIISNPPYIGLHEPHWQQGDLRFEPRQALLAEEEGLKALRIIIGEAIGYLKNNAWLMLEHGYQQHLAISRLLKKANYSSIASQQDFAGHWRVTLARKA